MPRVDEAFKNRVFEIVAQIPKGKVMTYGQIAALCGAAWAAWEVGQIANHGPSDLPWQRVVNKQGGLARGWPNGGAAGHKAALEADGIAVSEDFKVDIGKLQWQPDQTTLL
ncbi:MAG TPA: MGMT family protein [Candidatus Saccharimonadales bacterium]|nr:MGMT family protein [Candidatus Saccharimonadales bacterium]